MNKLRLGGKDRYLVTTLVTTFDAEIKLRHGEALSIRVK